MKYLTLTVGLLGLASTALAKEHKNPNAARPYANPSAVIATEIEFATMAREKGQWTAFQAFAAPDAVMFTPAMVYAGAWLKGKANPAVAASWQPHVVWSSCDGTVAVSHGAWQLSGRTGYFTTVWQKQKDGKYKWVLDHTDKLNEPLAAPEMLKGQVADCPERGKHPAGPSPTRGQAPKGKVTGLPSLDPAKREGKSDDGTLNWLVSVETDGARNLSVEWKKDGAFTPVLIEEVDAPVKH